MSFPRTHVLAGNAVTSADAVIVPVYAEEGQRVVALDLSSGEERWSAEVGPAARVALAARSEDAFLLEDLYDRARVRRLSFGLGLRSGWIGPAPCGLSLSQDLEGTGGRPPYRFEIASGKLPPGLTLSSLGRLEGLTTSTGAHAFALELKDSLDRLFRQEVSLDVVAGQADARLGGPPVVCRGSPVTFDLPPGFLTGTWLPLGQDASTVTFSPSESLPIVVLGKGAADCPRRASAEIDVLDPEEPPLVRAPMPIRVLQNACAGPVAGATPLRSAEMRVFLEGGSARAVCSPLAGRLAVQERGVDVGLDTLFTAGSHQLSFRFSDAAGHVGAARSGIDVTILGDVNGDGRADNSDAEFILTFLVFQGGYRRNLDLNGDGRIDILDVVLLNAYAAGNVACLTP